MNLNFPSIPTSDRVTSLLSCNVVASLTESEYKHARQASGEFCNQVPSGYTELPIACLNADKQHTNGTEGWIYSLRTFVYDKAPVRHILIEHNKKKRYFVVTHYVGQASA